MSGTVYICIYSVLWNNVFLTVNHSCIARKREKRREGGEEKLKLRVEMHSASSLFPIDRSILALVSPHIKKKRSRNMLLWLLMTVDSVALKRCISLMAQLVHYMKIGLQRQQQ